VPEDELEKPRRTLRRAYDKRKPLTRRNVRISPSQNRSGSAREVGKGENQEGGLKSMQERPVF